LHAIVEDVVDGGWSDDGADPTRDLGLGRPDAGASSFVLRHLP